MKAIRPGPRNRGPFVGQQILASIPPAPFSQDDWPNPAPRKQVGESFIAVNLLLTVLAAPVVVPRAPLYSPRPAVQAQQQWTAPSLLLTTLGAAPIQPFAIEWDGLAQAKRAQPDVVQNLLTTVLAPAAGAAPFSQDDWPNPARRIAARVDTPVNLLLTPGLAPPFRPVELQTPKAVARAFQPEPQNLLSGVLAPAAGGSPFSQDEWPSPKPARALPPDTSQDLLATTLAPAVGAAPFRQLEWQSAWAVRCQDPWIVPNLQTGTLAPAVGAAPFKPYDWQQLRATSYRFEQPWPAPLALRSAGAAQTPFSQAEWPTQRPRRVQPSDTFQDLLGTTLAPAAAAVAPFVPYDWPSRQRAVVAPAEPSGSRIVLIGTPVAVPFRPIDCGGAQARSWQHPDDFSNLLITTLAPSQAMPQGQYDWQGTKRILARLQFDGPNLLETTLAPPPAPPVFDGPLSHTSFGTPRIREIIGFRIRVRYGIRIREDK